MAYKILAVNPGSTSTKVAVYLDREQQWVESISHTQEELKPYPNIYSQLDFRADLVRKCIEAHGDKAEDFDAAVGRGGLIPPVHAGAYEVNEAMLDCLQHRPLLQHASNLGAPIAYSIAKEAGCKAYIYDAVTVDEMEEIYRITGLPDVIRIGTTALRFQCLTFVLNGWITMNNMMMQTMGKTFPATLLASSRQGLFFIPALLILPQFLGLLGIQAAQAVSDIFTFVLTTVLNRRVMRSLTPDSDQKPAGH